MRKYQLKGTFNLNAGLFGNKDWLVQPGINVSHYKYERDKISDIYAGQEIAIHSMTHPDLARIPQSMAAHEISGCKNIGRNHTIPVTGMAYHFWHLQ